MAEPDRWMRHTCSSLTCLSLLFSHLLILKPFSKLQLQYSELTCVVSAERGEGTGGRGEGLVKSFTTCKSIFNIREIVG